MTLLFRYFLTMASVLALTFGFLYFLNQREIFSGFGNIEKDNAQSTVLRVERMLDVFVRDLKLKAVDWAAWSEAYDYLLDQNNEFLVNISPSALKTLGINYLFYLDKNGQVVISESVDLDSGERINFFPGYKDFLNAKFPEIIKSGEVGGVFALDNGGIFLWSGYPVIFPENLSFEYAAGVLVFIRYVDAAILNELSNVSLYPVQIMTINERQREDFLSSDKQVKVIESSAELIGSKVYGEDGNLAIRIFFTRDVLVQARRTLDWLFIALVITFSLVFTAWSGIIYVVIIRRVARLTRAVQRFDVQKGNEVLGINDGFGDELSILGRKLEEMFGSLYKNYYELQSKTKELETGKLEISNLNKSLEKFRLAVENSSDSICFVSPDKSIVYANKAMAGLTGYDIYEILGKDVCEICRPLPDDSFVEEIWNKIFSEKRIQEFEIENVCKNGKKYFAGIEIYPVLNDKKEIDFFVKIERDITKLKMIDRMKNEFVSIASHQLRAPISAVKWIAEILLEDDKSSNLTKEQKGFLNDIYESNENMGKLVSDLLNVSRIDLGEKFSIIKKKADVIGIINAAIHSQAVFAKHKQIKIKFVPKVSDLFLEVDEEKIKQVFINLLNNALKYTPEKGKVGIDIKEDIENKQIFFAVKDNGYGIPKAQMPKMFGKFARGDNVVSRNIEGTGLGLYIVKSIVEGHGGKVWVESEENKGSTFYFTLLK